MMTNLGGRRALVLGFVAFLVFSAPAFSSAAALSGGQIQAMLGLLEAFGVDAAVIAQVERALGGAPAGPAEPPPAPATPRVSTTDSVYRLGTLGYDMSYTTPGFSADRYGFIIVGVTRGKAFVDNALLPLQYSWARLGASTAPTIYMNLNAPYGTTVAGHTSSPKSCPEASSYVLGAEPTVCEGYNYGWSAAADAYAYTKENGASSSFWWLDIEEANSWSPDAGVNDATIQGAMDYLNAQGIRVGIYSTPRMWAEIAGTGFTPSQTIAGQAVSIPNWFPIGIATQVDATNACNTARGFTPGSPVWIIQWVADSTAIDQNIAC